MLSHYQKGKDKIMGLIWDLESRRKKKYRNGGYFIKSYGREFKYPMSFHGTDFFR